MEQTTTVPTHPHHYHRPLLVTMLCSFYFVFWAMNILTFIAALLMSIGKNFPAFKDIAKNMPLLFLGAVRLPDVTVVTWLVALGLIAGVVGYWLYQKWAVIVFTAASITLFIIALPAPASVQPGISYTALIFYIIVSVLAVNLALIVIGALHFKRMN